MARGPRTEEERRAIENDRDLMHAFHAGILARGLGGFYWARFPEDFDKEWTVVRIYDDGRADAIGWECGVDLRRAEIGAAIAEPPADGRVAVAFEILPGLEGYEVDIGALALCAPDTPTHELVEALAAEVLRLRSEPLPAEVPGGRVALRRRD